MRDLNPYLLMCGFCCGWPLLWLGIGWVLRAVFSSYKIRLQSPIKADAKVVPKQRMTKEEEHAAIRAIVAGTKDRIQAEKDKIGYG